MVKLIDYQAFVSAALLILGLLGYGGTRPHSSKQDKDRDLIGLTVATLRQASVTVNNPMASEAVEGLESLMLLDRDEGCPYAKDPTSSVCVNARARIVVPRIGTITISPGEYIIKTMPGSKSPPNSHAPPVFALSHGLSQGYRIDEVHTQAPNGNLNNMQDNGFQLGDGSFMEVAAIDFDWGSALNPSFEDDWAWLNDLNY